MENHVSLTSLMIVVTISFLVPIMINRLRWTFVPVVVAEIVAGIVVGKTGLNLVADDATLQLLSTLGLIYLLFLSGLEVDFGMLTSKQRQGNANPLKIAVAVFVLILAVSAMFGMWMVPLGLTDQPYLMAIIIATISLSIVMPVLKENHMTSTPYGQTVLLIAVISDFVTMILLAVFVSLSTDTGSHPLLIFTLFLAFFMTYHILKPLSKVEWFQKLSKGTVQIGTRGAFTLILFFVALSESVGAENILGAFLAGAILSLLAPKPELVHKLDSFGYGFLIPIFMVMVGVNLDLRALFSDPSVLLLVPYLLVALYAAKIVPSLMLRKWFSWRETLSSGVLLSSTLSLVIAAATVALELDLIERNVHDAFILVAVLTCVISPILFNRMKPDVPEELPPKISIVGVNGSTIPVGLELKKEGYRVTMYSRSQPKLTPQAVQEEVKFPMVELDQMELSELEKHNAFDTDVLVLATGTDEFNRAVAQYAKEQDDRLRVIVLTDDPSIQDELTEQGITAFSSLFATHTLLKGLIVFPASVRLLTQKGDSIQEITVNNERYNELLLRHLPFLGDALVLRIYRGEDSVIPHGDTQIKSGDRLLVSGSPEHIQQMRKELE